MADKVRVAVLISGRGTNMVALAEHKRRDPGRSYEIVLVASNVPEARGLVVARRLDIPTWARSHKGMRREDFDDLLHAQLIAHDVELVALAGYMRLLSPAFVDRWDARILNIHPSLLPLYPGLDTHRRAIEAGDAYGGCSVHVVTHGLDDGPLVAQAKVRIRTGETPDSLAERVLKEEHSLYPVALERYCEALRTY